MKMLSYKNLAAILLVVQSIILSHAIPLQTDQTHHNGLKKQEYLPPKEEELIFIQQPEIEVEKEEYLPPVTGEEIVECTMELVNINGKEELIQKGNCDLIQAIEESGGVDVKVEVPEVEPEVKAEGYDYPRPSKGFQLPLPSNVEQRVVLEEVLADGEKVEIPVVLEDARRRRNTRAKKATLRTEPNNGHIKIHTSNFVTKSG